MKRISILFLIVMVIMGAATIIKSQQRQDKISCANCRMWYFPQDMKKVIPQGELKLIVEPDCSLTLCKLCAHKTFYINLRQIERNERAKGISEKHVLFHSLIAYELKQRSELVHVQDFISTKK